MERGPLPHALEVDKKTDEATEGSGEHHADGHDGHYQGAFEDGTFHEPYNDFKIPAGPVPQECV
eukprot:9189344-Prorocentrum_lima.AAC.1